MALVYNWSVCAGEFSFARLHAAAISYNLVKRPPKEFYNEASRHIIRRLNKAIYGLRSSPEQWQVHIAHILTVTLELVRCTTESNVYRLKGCKVYIVIYVDDLLLIGAQSIIDTLFSRMQKEALLRHASDLNVGTTLHFLGRNISHNILEESGMTTCAPAPSPGVSHMRGAAEDEGPLDHEQQHKQHRRLVGKVPWLAYTRPDISYGAKELARSLTTTV